MSLSKQCKPNKERKQFLERCYLHFWWHFCLFEKATHITHWLMFLSNNSPNAPMLTNYNEEEKARCYNSTTHDPIERCPRHVTHLTRWLRSRWRELLVISPRSQFLKIISPRSQFLRITWFGPRTQYKHYTVFADLMQKTQCKTKRTNHEGTKKSYSART